MADREERIVIALWVALAGGGGAVVRFALDTAVRSRRASDFPWATFGINVSGSLLLGVLTGLVMFSGDSPTLRTVAGAGFCGGYTTFSAASFEAVRLFQRRRTTLALANLLGTLAATTAAAAAGLGISQL